LHLSASLYLAPTISKISWGVVKINAVRFMIKLDDSPWPPPSPLKNGSRAPDQDWNGNRHKLPVWFVGSVENELCGYKETHTANAVGENITRELRKSSVACTRTSFVSSHLSHEHAMVIESFDDSRSDWNHHRCRWYVCQPHRQKPSHAHEPERDPERMHIMSTAIDKKGKRQSQRKPVKTMQRNCLVWISLRRTLWLCFVEWLLMHAV